MAGFFEGLGNVLGVTILVLPISAGRVVFTIIIFIVINSGTVGMRNDCFARRASANAAAPAASLIFGNQRLYDIELAALLDKDATAAPVAAAILTRHSLVVRNVNLAVLTSANCCHRTSVVTASDTQTAALSVLRHVAGNRAASHFKLDGLVVKTSVNATASLMGVVSSN